METKELIEEILRRLKKVYSVSPQTALHFSSPFELLVATVLSAQTTDARVNKVTELLFKRYRGPADFANTPPETIAKDIQSVNFFITKAKNIHNASKILINEFNGEVPKTMQELISLPGVARKTANIVLSGALGLNEGIAVDTHVRRLANRLGLTKNDDPKKIETDLLSITPRDEWGNLSHLLIFHGRSICRARSPKHADCVLADICPSKNI